MAGRSRKVRNIQSYINNIDNHTFSGPMKSGLAPSIGVTRNFWYNYGNKCSTHFGKHILGNARARIENRL